MSWEVREGDCLEVMASMPDGSVDAICTDPPYGLGFMGKEWDALPPGREWAEQCLRVLKPGGHLLAFGGSRTYHRLAVAVEDAGFEIRDQIMWLYGSGFPKSLDVSKAIDRAAGAERDRVPTNEGIAPGGGNYGGGGMQLRNGTKQVDTPATDQARRWSGWGTALKPAWESVVVAQKPSGELDTIRRNLWVLHEQLRSLANGAESSSPSSEADSSEGMFASAEWNADEQRNTRADLLAQMDMSQFESALNTSLNTVSSWSSTLDGLCEVTNMFTTATRSSTTTALRTLKSSLSDLTPRIIIQAATSPGGSALSALPAARAFAAVELRLSATRELLAPAPVTSESPEICRGALAPDSDSVVVARKPLVGTVAQNVERFGVGGLNIDGCRVGTEESVSRLMVRPSGDSFVGSGQRSSGETASATGRWPANLVLDEQAGAMLDAQSGEQRSGTAVQRNGGGQAIFGGINGSTNAAGERPDAGYGDTGGASRFFYTAKASRAERNAGLDGFEERTARKFDGGSFDSASTSATNRIAKNHHPTVKPIDLMRWLVRLVTPPGGTVLDPFTGSGTTGIAAVLEGFEFIGIEREPEYREIAEARIEWWSQFEGDTTDILQRAGLAEKAQAEHVERGQLDLLGEAA